MENPFESAVFIVGAGASKPYGFPTGIELRKEILALENCHPDCGFSSANSAHTTFLNHLKGVGYEYSDIKKFCSDFSGTGSLSIDDFLQHYAKGNHPFYRLGQMLIYYLISLEERLWAIQRAKSDWIELLLRFLMDKSRRDSFLRKPPTFISFNYDNFLKHKVEFNLRTLYRIDDFQLNGVIHVHGKTSGKNFSKENDEIVKVANFDEIEKESRSISLIRDEDFDEDSNVRLIRQKILEAKRVFVMGYSFNRSNNRLLFKDLATYHRLTVENKIVSTGLIEDRLLIDAVNLTVQNGLKTIIKPPFNVHEGLNCEQLIDKFIPREIF